MANQGRLGDGRSESGLELHFVFFRGEAGRTDSRDYRCFASRQPLDSRDYRSFCESRPRDSRDYRRARSYAALTAATSFVSESLASPKNMTVFGPNMRSLSMPANPGRIERFMKMMFFAWSAFRIGMP